MTVGERIEFSAGQVEDEVVRPAGLTVEIALYVLVGLLAAVVRLWGLDAWPLRAGEAMSALGAWNLSHGMPVGVGDYSPLLVTGNMLLFGLFRASDAAARVWPAIFGVLLALTPALLRHRLGRAGALIASLLLALSPTLMFISRALDGRIVAVTAGFVLAAAIVRLIDTGDRGNLFLATVALAVGLLSGPLFYTILVILIAGALILWLLRKPLELDLGAARAGRAWNDLRRDTALWTRLGSLFAALLMLLGTGFFFNLDGFGAGADLFPAWLCWFAWGLESLSPAVTLWSLALYETLLLVFGIAGLVVGWKRRDAFSFLLGWWAMIGLVFSLAAGGWQPADLVLLAVPLAVLAGKLLGELVESAFREPLVDGEWIILGLSVVLAIFGYITFGQYSRSGRQIEIIMSVVIAPLIFIAVVGVIVVWIGWRRVLRGAGLALAMLLIAVMVSTAWGSSHNADPARRDLLSMDRTEIGVRDLVSTMERYSVQQLRHSASAPVLVVGDELTGLKWDLRHFREVAYVDLFDEVGQYKIVLSPFDVEPPLGELYSGQDIVVRSSWRPTNLKGKTLARWLLLREPPQQGTRESVILWIPRQEQGLGVRVWHGVRGFPLIRPLPRGGEEMALPSPW